MKAAKAIDSRKSNKQIEKLLFGFKGLAPNFTKLTTTNARLPDSCRAPRCDLRT
jgi:hypothetical protein